MIYDLCVTIKQSAIKGDTLCEPEATVFCNIQTIEVTEWSMISGDWKE